MQLGEIVELLIAFGLGYYFMTHYGKTGTKA